MVFVPVGALLRLAATRRCWSRAREGANRHPDGSASCSAVSPARRTPKESSAFAGAACALISPSAVAIAPWEAPVAFAGSVYRANIELGARSTLSLLPVVGGWWEE